MLSESARLGLAALAVAVCFAAMNKPSAAQDSGKPAAGDAAAKVEKGKALFADYACGSCHSLSDAGATGHVGPSLDGDRDLTQAFIVNRLTNGQGGMPAFAGQLSPEEMDALAAYVVHAASK